MAEQQYKAAIVLLLAVARRVQENLSGYGEAERFQELIDAVDIPLNSGKVVEIPQAAVELPSDCQATDG